MCPKCKSPNWDRPKLYERATKDLTTDSPIARHPMPNPLDGARLKIARAQEHLEAFNEVGGRYIRTEPYGIVSKVEGDFIHVEGVITVEPPRCLACIVGDFVTNLRASLDYIAWELAMKAGRSLSDSQKRRIAFPIALDKASFSKKDGTAAHLERVCGIPATTIAVIESVQPFDGLYLPGSITEVGCWAHARRHFHEARDSDAARSAEAIARIRGFYAIEDDATKQIAQANLTGDAAEAVRLHLRQEKTVPQLADLAKWLDEQAKIVLPKGPLGQAIAYAQRQWPALLRFTEHGFLNIDNNASERALRAIAVGRKNWLFAGSDRGGHTAAILYTMTQTCKQHDIDPFVYLRDVFSRLPGLPVDRLTELLPVCWAQSQ